MGATGEKTTCVIFIRGCIRNIQTKSRWLRPGPASTTARHPGDCIDTLRNAAVRPFSDTLRLAREEAPTAPFLLIATWNDHEEGTAIEGGLAKCSPVTTANR